MTQAIKSFKELNLPEVETIGSGYIGDKIAVAKVLGKSIVIHRFKITDSKYPEKGNGLCLWIQIELNGVRRVIFTSSVGLQQTLLLAKQSDFPFSTVIEMTENDAFKLT